jgi:cytochrome b
MVEYAILVAHNSATFMSGVGGDLLSWASRLDWSMLGYVAAGLVLLRLAFGVIKPTRRY